MLKYKLERIKLFVSEYAKLKPSQRLARVLIRRERLEGAATYMLYEGGV